MPFKRLFGRGDDAPPPPPPDEFTDEDDASLAPEAGLDADGLDREWHDRAVAVIPGGTSTGSKRAAALYGPGNDAGPTHFASAQGCRVVTVSGRQLLDCTMALGSVAVGYSDDAINRAVLTAVASGNVCGLATLAEVEVAERLCDMIPCAEQVRFLKSGGEGVAAAVRIARVATGRPTVIGCGYFGWQDWWNEGAGIPDGAHADFVPIPFDDVPALERAVSAAGATIAAVLLEPVIHRLPCPNGAWWRGTLRCGRCRARVRQLKTGFRHAWRLPKFAGRARPRDLRQGNGEWLSDRRGGGVEPRQAAAETWISTARRREWGGRHGRRARHHAEVDVCATLA
jgi:hypothetical protein